MAFCQIEGRVLGGMRFGVLVQLFAIWGRFVASWRLLGFSASWLLGILASRLLASSAFPVPLWQVAFWLLRLFAGLCGFWRLWLFASWLLHPFIGFWIWLPAS